MNRNEWRVLADMLHLAGMEFSFHGCNDYSLPNTPENLALLVALEKWNVSKSGEEPYKVIVSPDGKELYTSDVSLMSYFAHLARKEGEELNPPNLVDQSQPHGS